MKRKNRFVEKIETHNKTDRDATAMVLKKDYYSKNSKNFHVAYNVQVIVSSSLILMYGVYQNRSDYYTLIPMLEKFEKYYGYYPKNLCADSEYGIMGNYKFINQNEIGNYVKFQSWEGEVNGKRPQLFKLNKKEEFVCLNNIVGKEYKTNSHPKIENGKNYIWEGCNNCDYVYKCKAYFKNKEKNFRIKELSIEYEKYKEQARTNLLSPEGIEIRINRSIQVEGTFGQIKNNMRFDRFRRRGLKKKQGQKLC